MTKESMVFIQPAEGDLKACVRSCFNAFGGVDALVKGNVFIKINGTMPDRSSITTPEVILATIEVIKEASEPPKKIYIFDNCAVGFFTRLVFAVDNLGKRIRKLGAKPIYLDEQKPIMVDFDGKALDKPIPIPKILYENLIERKTENTYINIPKLKTHLQTNLTNCLKNQHGLLYDEEKIYNHHLIEEKIIDLLQVFQPNFHLVDATSVVDYGQIAIIPKYFLPMGLLLAGKDPVAVDTIGAELLGISDVKHIRMAAEHGFGCDRLDQIEVLPSRALISQYKKELHCKNIPLKPSPKIRLIKGKEQACRTGCLTLGLYFIIFTHDSDFGPCIGVIGKGHDTSELDKFDGPFIVNGPCAIAELRAYFEARKQHEKIKVHYIKEHCDLAELAKCVRKVAKIPLSRLSDLTPISTRKLLGLLIISKLHRAHFKFII
ncbi:MAG: DUF362 domain-containing protein [Candidatus Helarchaeota archaeon]